MSKPNQKQIEDARKALSRGRLDPGSVSARELRRHLKALGEPHRRSIADCLDALDAVLRSLGPDVRTPQPGPVATRARPKHLYWPETLDDAQRARLLALFGDDGLDHKGHPTKWLGMRPTYPCRRCDRIATNEGLQAVICDGRHSGLAYLHCRVCSHRWTLEVL